MITTTISVADALGLTIPSAETTLLGPTKSIGGAYSIMHQVIARGVVSPAHRHAHEDQVAIVLDGRLGFWVEDSNEVEATAGTAVLRPRGLFHAVWNTSGEPATILEITSPGENFEEWMGRLSDINASGAAEQEEVRRVAKTFGIEFAGPEDPDGSRRHGDTESAAFWRR